MDSYQTPAVAVDIDNLAAVKILGKGATGTVFLVGDDSSSSSFALKVVEKSSAASRRGRREISVLSRLCGGHPFLSHLICSSEDEEFIYWGIPYCPGGDLNVLRYLQNDHVFSTAVIRFYLAEIICALQHLHQQGIVYRDLKPENILVQLSGHVMLTDFDLSRDLNLSKSYFSDDAVTTYPIPNPKSNTRTRTRTRFNIGKNAKKTKSARVSPVSRRNPNSNSNPNVDYFSGSERSNSFVGTEEYVAPEIIRGDGHQFAVDWWALGVLAYEMVYGKTPFKGRNRKDTFRRILLGHPEYIGKPDALTDLIGKLLEKDPTRRLGHRRGAAEIMEHHFFRGLRWELLTEVSRPPFLPSRDEVVAGGGTINIKDHFRRAKLPPSPLWSPSRDDLPEF